MTATPAAEPCEGFRWIGQPFYSCDNCGRPAWEHAGMHTFDFEQGLVFDAPSYVKPWEPGEAEAIRAKWEPSWHAANGCSAGPGTFVHGENCPARKSEQPETPAPAAEPTVRVTRYTVTCIPPDHAPDAHVWALYVEQKRDGTWVVTNGHEYLDEAGQWHPGLWASLNEPARFFDEETALRVAREAAPKVVVNGRTVPQALTLTPAGAAVTPSQDLAAKAYGAYGAVTNFRNFQGDSMPAWDELPVKIRAAWANAATAAWTQAVRDLAPLLGRDERELFALLVDGEAGR